MLAHSMSDELCCSFMFLCFDLIPDLISQSCNLCGVLVGSPTRVRTTGILDQCCHKCGLELVHVQFPIFSISSPSTYIPSLMHDDD